MENKYKLDTEEIRFGAVAVVSRREYDQDTDRIAHMITDRLRLTMADKLVRERVEKSFTDERVEFRCDLYIATPEKFWQLVNIAAERIAMQYGRTISRNY